MHPHDGILQAFLKTLIMLAPNVFPTPHHTTPLLIEFVSNKKKKKKKGFYPIVVFKGATSTVH